MTLIQFIDGLATGINPYTDHGIQTLRNTLMGEDAKHCTTFEPPRHNGVAISALPIEDIDNEVFLSLHRFIEEQQNNKGYRNKMSSFNKVVRLAQSQSLNDHALHFQFRKQVNCKQYPKRKYEAQV